MISLLCDAIMDDRNGDPNHTSSMSIPQQTSRNTTISLFFGQQLFTPPNYKRIKQTILIA